MTTKLTEAEKDELRGYAADTLRSYNLNECHPYVYVTKVNRNGDRRRLEVFVPYLHGRGVLRVTEAVAKVLDKPCNEDGLLVVGGGIDMRQWLARSLSVALYNDPDAVTL